MENLERCPNCESTNLTFHLKARDWHYGNEGEFNLDKCSSCGLIFLNPMMNDDELAKYYPQGDYYSFYRSYDIPEPPPRIRERVKQMFFGKTSKKEKEPEFTGKILDIGCGNGWVLYQYKKKGWEVAGVEPSKVAADMGNEQGLNIFNGTLLESNFPDNEFDFILSNHSFEHIYNPNEVLKEIHRILKPNGKVTIGVPNVKGLNSKLAKEYWYYLGAPVHTFNYSDNNLSQLLTKHKFKVQQVNYVSNAHGILGSIQNYLNRKKHTTINDGVIVRSKVLRLMAAYLARFQNYLRVGDCIDIIAIKN